MDYALFFALTAGFIGIFIYALVLLPPGSVSLSSGGSGGSGGGSSGRAFSGGAGSSGGDEASGRW